MAYMILARHHYRNQSTIKNRALLKAAAYINNRSLLRNYLEDTLIPPKHKPVPVANLQSILDKKKEDAPAKSVELEKKNTSEPVVDALPDEVVAVEAPALEAADAQPAVEASAIEASEIGETPAITIDAVVAEEPLVASVTAPPVKVVEGPETVVEMAAEPDVEVVEGPETVVEMAAETGVELTEAQPVVAELTPVLPEQSTATSPDFVHAGKAGEVNWFLNMRMKLRADKHKATTSKLVASIERHAQMTQANPATATAVLESPVDAPSIDANVAEVAVSAPSPEVVEAKVALISPAVEQVASPEAAETIAEADTPTVAEAQRESKTSRKKEKKSVERVPEKQYEIGAFSSFTFLSESEQEEQEEEIGMATMEAVEFKAGDGENGNGEIIFEENDRIIEISVSPAALNKYFKGRLPSEPAPSFGTFHIELDESEYRADVEQHAHDEASTAIDPSPGLSFELLDREAKPSVLPKEKVESIIDRFIENEPGITRAKTTGIVQGDLAKESNKPQDEDWVTETLARIYEKQGNKAKAIKIYERLRLRIPEKNDYFVSLIEKLKH